MWVKIQIKTTAIENKFKEATKKGQKDLTRDNSVIG